MTSQELIKELGIVEESYEEDGKTIVVIANSDDYSKIFTKLDNSDYLEIDDESTIITQELGETVFYSDTLKLRLIASFTDDVYRLIMEEEK